MELKAVAKEMRKNAVDLDLPHLMQNPTPEKCALAYSNMVNSQRVVSYKSHRIRLTFTMDTVGPHWAWHLSFGCDNGTILSQEIVNDIVDAFFPGVPLEQLREVPSIHGKRVRQFLQIKE